MAVLKRNQRGIFIFITSLLLCYIAYSSAILIKTSDLETTIYAGPNGTVNSQFQNNEKKIAQVGRYESTAYFIILPSTSIEGFEGEVFGPPLIQVVSGKSIEPVIFGTANDGYIFDAEDWIEFSDLNVYFNCKRNGVSTLSISITTSIMYSGTTFNETVVFFLQKNCLNSGVREGFTITKNEHAIGDVVRHGTVQSKWSIDSDLDAYKDPVVIDSDEHISTFYISISSESYGNQYYDAPIVKVTDQNIVDVKVRGNAQSGAVATTSPETLVLMYTCLDAGSTEIVVEISLGFYGILTFGFIKDCDADVEEGVEVLQSGVINVGTSRTSFANVIENNLPAFNWIADNPIFVVGEEEISSIFYISTLSGKEQQFLKPVITIHPPGAFQYTLTGAARDGGIATGAPQRLVINYICDRSITTQVIVSFKLPGYDTVEFGFHKNCKKLVRHTDHIWTANQVLMILGVVVVVLVGIYFMLGKSNKNNNIKL